MKKEKEFEEPGAIFNTGIAITRRLNELFIDASVAARTGRFESWWSILLCLEREASSEMNDDDRKMVGEAKRKAAELLDIYNKNPIQKHVNTTFSSLHNYEIAIRQVIKRTGLGMPNKSDARFALGN